MYVQSVHDVLKAEMDLYVTISPEEWQLLKPKESSRAGQIMTKLKNYLRNEGQCGNCTGWSMKAAELTDVTLGPSILDVGYWEPMQGSVLKDDLFPHVTGGLRGRLLTVASVDVSRCIQFFQNVIRGGASEVSGVPSYSLHVGNQ